MFKKFYYWFHRITSKPEERGEYSSGHWQDLVRAKAAELFKDKKGNMLEIGCGEGLFLNKLDSQNAELKIFGLDLWRGILFKASKQLGKEVSFIQGNALHLPFKNNSFDNIVCINVFFNLPSSEAVLESFEEISRVCKKDGTAVFDIRNSLNPVLFFKYKFARYYDETVKGLPLTTYRFSMIASFLENRGFEIINKIYIGFPYNTFSPIVIIEARKK